MSNKYVYDFKEGGENTKDILGIKGARLSELANLNLPIPPGFIVSTDGCRCYFDNKSIISDVLYEEIMLNIEKLENTTGKKFGDLKNPLIVSVRSSEAVEIRGMSDVVLNLGVNDDIACSIAKQTNNERFALEVYANFISTFMYAVLPEGRPDTEIDNTISSFLCDGYKNIADKEIREFIKKAKIAYKDITKQDFPDDPEKQLIKAIEAVFNSWHSKRAKVYRRINQMTDIPNVGAIVQEMIFGNLNSTSGIGYIFSRNPENGEDNIFPKFHINTQREISIHYNEGYELVRELNKVSSACLEGIKSLSKSIERHFKDMQYIDLVIQDSKPYVVTVQNGRRSAEAALNIAVDMVNEGIITKNEAVSRVSERNLKELTLPVLNKKQLIDTDKIAEGLPASKGATCGKVYFSIEKAQKEKLNGEKVIFISEWIRGSEENETIISLLDGIITGGGMTSDGAIMARGVGRPCISIKRDMIKTYEDLSYCMINRVRIHEGEYIAIDGTSGKVYKGSVDTVDRERTGRFGVFMDWLNEINK